jgi:hypothetical protein
VVDDSFTQTSLILFIQILLMVLFRQRRMIKQ